MKIAYITNGFSGNLNNSYELSRRLTIAGHEVIYISPVDISKRAEQNGFKCIVLAEDLKLQQDFNVEQQSSNFISTWKNKRKLIQQQRKRMLKADELKSVIKDISPDRILIDIELHYVVIFCSTLEIPCFLVSAWFSIFSDDKNLPPMHTFLTPTQDKNQQAQIKQIWDSESKTKRHRHLRYQLKHYLKFKLFPKPLSYQSLNTVDLEILSKNLGVDFDKVTDFSSWLRPLTFKHLPILVFNILEMDFRHHPDPRLHYVGPMIDVQREDPTYLNNSSDHWTHLKQKLKSESNKKTLLYCSLGTFWKTDKDFLLKIIDVVKNRPDWHLVIGLGGKSKASEFNDTPDNVTLLEWAPQLQVLQLADVAITHGGISTINECVLYEVPMLVYSTEHGDQNGCAVRVDWHGLGIMGNKQKDDQKTIESHLENLLSNESIRSNLKTMQSHFFEYERKQVAVQLIESGNTNNMGYHHA